MGGASWRKTGNGVPVQGPARYVVLALFVVLCVVIAIVFDSPTSVILLVLLALLALGFSFGSGRRAP